MPLNFNMEGMGYFLFLFLFTIIWIQVLCPIAIRFDLVDHPGGRKIHKRITPLVGGIAIYISLLFAWFLFSQPDYWLSILISSLILLLIGIIDDRFAQPPKVRFIAQIIAALIIVYWSQDRLNYLGNLLGHGEIQLNHWAIPFTLFSAIGVINATNMLDGLDGLAGGILLLIFFILFILSFKAGFMEEAQLLFSLIAALIGFLLFNFRFIENQPARIFMGDGGSLVLGLILAWLLIRFSQPPQQLFRPITAVWLFGLPLMDTVSIMIRRILKGRSPFLPDKEHFHHLLLELGFSTRNSVLIAMLISSLFITVGLLGEYYQIAESIMFKTYLAVFIIYFIAMQKFWQKHV